MMENNTNSVMWLHKFEINKQTIELKIDTVADVNIIQRKKFKHMWKMTIT